jgi:hypothetical protein
MKDDGGKEAVINNIIKSNENFDSEFYLIPIKLSIFTITNLLYYVTEPGYNCLMTSFRNRIGTSSIGPMVPL